MIRFYKKNLKVIYSFNFVGIVLIMTAFLAFDVNVRVFAQVDRAKLEAELKQLELEAQTHQQNIKQKQTEKVSIERDISILNTKIKKTETEIKSSEKMIQSLAYNIADKNKKISMLSEKIDENEQNISDILQEIEYSKNNDIDMFLFTKKSLSDIVDGLYKKESLQDALGEILIELQNNKKKLEGIKNELEEDRTEEQINKNKQLSLKKEVEVDKSKKNQILTITKGEEKKYQSLLSETQQKIASIRARLFELRDTGAISFGQAYDFALLASKNTGVRPALILAILQQESAMGANVGQCYVNDDINGDGVRKNGAYVKGVMNPNRDVPKFKSIAADLGFDWKTQVVSCPIPSAGGWGGAMGPSQFIPSTWEMYKQKIAKAVGVTTPNPWNAYHAITATAVYLQDLGAVAYDESSEKNAACRYYSGRSCSATSAGNGYGNSVMKKVSSVQADINTIR